MAGDWIKMECCTPEKAEVLAITAKMGWDDVDVTVGKLFRMWRWFDQQTEGGNARGVTSALLDRVIGVTGFCEAVQSVGWIEINQDGISLPNFDRHNGTTAKSRALGAKRTAKSKNKSKGSADGNADGDAKGNARTVTKTSPREEKRREDAVTEVTERRNLLESGFDAFWQAWPSHPRKADRSKCLSFWKAEKLSDSADKIVASVNAWKRSAQWTKDDGQFIPGPLPWLRKKAFEAPAPASAPSLFSSSHSGFATKNYSEGINDDGSFT